MTTSRSRAGPAPAASAAEVVDTLTEAQDHLDFARGALRHLRSGSAAHAAVGRRIAAVEERMADPRHHLAVVGEFNSGKSTLVNALLGEVLLASNPWPTTQTTTRLRHGDHLLVRCEFRDDPRQHEFPGTGSAAWRALAAKLRAVSGAPVPRPAGVRQLLALLTADEQVARAVRAVTIDHPAPVLAEGLVVIDTPGTNADAGHTAIARTVLEEEADAAVVLLTADTPLGESLVAFLQEALDARLLARCLFVVTKMAHVDEDEEQGLLDAVRRRIRTKLGIADPVVLPVSVGCVVRQLQGKAPTAAEARWVARFADTAAELTALLAQRRAIGVADRVLRLLDDLLEALHKDLGTRSAALQREEKALGSSGLADLDGFLAQRRRVTRDALLRVETTTGTSLDRALSGLPDTLARRGAAALAGPAAGRRQRLEAAVQGQLAQVEAACLPSLRTAAGTLATVVRDNERAFAQGYAKLAPLGATVELAGPRAPALDPETLMRGSLRDVWALTARQDATENRLLGSGAAAGAVLGTMIIPIPVLGTALGALVGAGSVLFGAGKRERALRDQVESSMRALAARVRGKVVDRAGALAAERTAVATQRLDAVAAHYRPLVRKAVDGHRRRLRDLGRRRRDIDAEIDEIGRRRRRVTAGRERLATTPRRHR